LCGLLLEEVSAFCVDIQENPSIYFYHIEIWHQHDPISSGVLFLRSSSLYWASTFISITQVYCGLKQPSQRQNEILSPCTKRQHRLHEPVNKVSIWATRQNKTGFIQKWRAAWWSNHSILTK
jgi:hypothetical protein